jgi:hypothetical protein
MGKAELTLGRNECPENCGEKSLQSNNKSANPGDIDRRWYVAMSQ